MDEGEKRILVEGYLDEMLKINKTVNLTRIDSRPEADILHIEDSLKALPEMNEAPCGRYADLGSGCGFPGVALGLYTGRDTLLVDSVKKKMAAVNQVLNHLALQHLIRVYDGRIEELAVEQPCSFAVLTARALSKLSSLVELASPLLETKGRLICFKGRVDRTEITAADKILDITGMRFVSLREFVLSDGETRRTLVVYEKVAEPQITLPRRNGMAQKNPLA